ncbi:MAG: beta-N-acetylhexosaminidase [FCB group bacterium]|nr:beta-N-acetylhexosaminidase [FCB group bacterium]
MDTIKTPIIPIPVSLKMDHGFFCIAENTLIKTDFSEPEQIRIATYLSEILESFYKLNLKICDSAENNPCKSIHLKILAGSDDLSPEAYHLNIATEGIVISAHHSQGLFRGIQTLRQLLPVLLENSGTSIKLQAMEIADFPRFAWRGFMLDVARHFFRVEDVKRIIDLMVFYKMNRLHLHLSDDQGWRLEIKSWPNLTVHGGSSAVNGDPGGFYSQADYMEIIEYAQTNYIMVIPEIDMPGHTNAILSSYPELNADGIAPPLYTGMDVGFCSLNTENELTYQFVDDVVREIAELTLGGYIHIGGDEAISTKDDSYLLFVPRG